MQSSAYRESEMATKDGFALQAQLLRALAHPARLQILHILAAQEACVCHLSAALRRPQPYVSQQLAKLREAGLVTDRREGALIYYQLADSELAEWLLRGRVFSRDQSGQPAVFVSNPAEQLKHCPCPQCQEMINGHS